MESSMQVDHASPVPQHHDDNNANMATFRLLDLPPELVGHVADSAERDDILNLRLVNHAVNSASEDAFLDTFFKIRRHLKGISALKVLVSISEIPSLLKKIEKIEICTFRLKKKTIRSWFEDDEHEGDTILQMEGFDTARDIAHWEHLSDSASDEIYELMQMTLKNLVAAGKSPILSVQDGSHNYLGNVYGLPSLARRMRESVSPAAHWSDFRALASCDLAGVLLQACAATAYPLSNLDLCMESWYNDGYGADDDTFHIEDHLRPALSTCLGTLKSLELCVHTSNGCWWVGNDGREFAAFLTAAINLKELALAADGLELGSIDYGSQSVVMLVAEKLRAKQLSKLHITALRARAVDFALLVSKVKATVQNMLIKRCVIPYEDSWCQVLECVVDCDSLTDFSFWSIARFDAVPAVVKAILGKKVGNRWSYGFETEAPYAAREVRAALDAGEFANEHIIYESEEELEGDE